MLCTYAASCCRLFAGGAGAGGYLWAGACVLVWVWFTSTCVFAMVLQGGLLDGRDSFSHAGGALVQQVHCMSGVVHVHGPWCCRGGGGGQWWPCAAVCIKACVCRRRQWWQRCLCTSCGACCHVAGQQLGDHQGAVWHNPTCAVSRMLVLATGGCITCRKWPGWRGACSSPGCARAQWLVPFWGSASSCLLLLTTFVSHVLSSHRTVAEIGKACVSVGRASRSPEGMGRRLTVWWCMASCVRTGLPW